MNTFAVFIFLGPFRIRKHGYLALIHVFPCQSCSESCAFQAVAAVVDFVYQIKAIQKKAKKRKVLVGSPSESSWSVEKSGRQHRKNGLGVDALTGIFLQTYPDAPVSQATVSSAAKGSVPVEAASASFSRKKVEPRSNSRPFWNNPGRAAFYFTF